MVAKGSPDWLPSGWTVQFRVLKTGRRAQIYVNLETGEKFFSKDDAVHHIKMGYSLRGKPQSAKRLIESHSGRNPLQGLVNEKDTNPEWLPNGWKVEVRTRKSGVCTGVEYKCYVDPLNRCKFYSKPAVFRYLRTVKHKNGMFKKKTGIRVHSSNKPSTEAKRQTLKHPTTRRQIFVAAGKRSSRMSELSKIEGSNKSYGKRTSPEATVASAIRAENVPDSLTNETKDCAETNQSDALNGSSWSKAGGHKRSQGKRLQLPKTEEFKQTRGKADIAKKGLASTPAPDILPEKNSIPLVMEKKSYKNPQMIGARSKDKKFFNLPRRSSKRLAAGLQLDQVVNSMSGEQGLSSAPATDILQENNSIPPVIEKKSFKKPQMTSSRSKNKKFLNSPRRSSKRLAGLQPDQVVSLMSDEQGLASSSATEFLQEKNSIPPVMVKKSSRKPQMTSSRYKDKKFLNLPCRSSKRLAGLDPDKLVNLKSGERSLQFSIGKSSKTRAILDACLTSSDSMVDGASTQHEFGQEKDLERHASTATSTPLYGDSSNKSTIPTEDQVAPEEQKQKVESGKIENEKPEPHLSFLFESDPCLEFAFKTLTGELPVADAADDLATLITEPGMLQHENLHESGIKRSSNETGWIRPKKSKKKKVFKATCRSSKRLAGLEPELAANSLSGEGFLENAIKKSHKNDDPPASDLADEAIQHLWAVPETVPANYFSTNMNTSTHEEPSNEQPITGQRTELGNHFSAHIDTSPEIVPANYFSTNMNTSTHAEPSNEQPIAGQRTELGNHFSAHVDTSPETVPANYLSTNMNTSTHAEPSNEQPIAGQRTELGNHFSAHVDTSPETIPANYFSTNMSTSTHAEPSNEQPIAGQRTGLGNHFSAHVETSPETVPANYFSTNMNTSTHAEPSNEQPIAGQRTELGNHFSAHVDTSPETELANPNVNISLHEEPLDMQLDGDQGIELSNFFSDDVEISTHAEPSNKSEKSLEDPEVPEKQPHVEAQMGDLEKPEPQLGFSVGDCWSDPCLDFAFKTLTGAIPIEDNLVQGYFQEQLNTSHNHKNGSLALPDFGSPSLFQSDISSHFDSPEKSVSSQQLSLSSSLLPPGNVSLPSCSGAHSQEHCLEGDKVGKVKS